MQKQEITFFDNVTPVAVTSSTDATPIVVTATAHGRQTGDRVLIFGHTTNVAANGIFVITRITANTFSLQDEISGANIAGSGGGAGSSGIVVPAPPVVLIQDFDTPILQVGTSGTTTATLKVAGSNGKPPSVQSSPRWDLPNFGATVTPQNPYSFLQIINLDTAAAVNGATGIVVAGTDINNTYEVNINSIKYLTIIPISWSAGAITIKAIITGNSTV